MSASYSLQSLAQPYFAAVQDRLDFMDSPNAPQMNLGISYCAWYIDIAVRSLPQQNASADEVHVLASYHEAGASGVDILYIGITPSGRLVGYDRANGTTLSTNKGFIVADGAFRRLGYSVESVTTNLVRWAYADDGVTIFHESIAATAAGPGAVNMSPAAGLLGEMMLFNGRTGLTRCDCELRFARLFGSDAYQDYLFDEGRDFTLGDTTTALLAQPINYFGALDVGQVIPFSYGKPLVWGTIPEFDLPNACRWNLRTDWTKTTPVSTEWTKQAVT